MFFFLDAIQRRWLAGCTENVAFANKLIVDQQSVEHPAQPSTTKISHSLDEKTVQKTQEILADIGNDKKIDNAVHLMQLKGKLNSKDVFLCYVER